MNVLSMLILAATVEARDVATTLATRLQTSHIDHAAAETIASDLRKRASVGEFDGLAGDELAKALNARIRVVTTDPHLGIRYSTEPFVEPGTVAPSPEDRDRERRFAAAQNFGFEKVERLPRERNSRAG